MPASGLVPAGKLRHSASSQRLPHLGIEDIYKLAEVTRMRMTLESRTKMLTEMQKRVRNGSTKWQPLAGLQFNQSHSAQIRTRTVEGMPDERQSPGFVRSVQIKAKSDLASTGEYSNDDFVKTSDCSAVDVRSSTRVRAGHYLSESEPGLQNVSGQGDHEASRDCYNGERLNKNFLRMNQRNIASSTTVTPMLPDIKQPRLKKFGSRELGKTRMNSTRSFNNNSVDNDAFCGANSFLQKYHRLRGRMQENGDLCRNRGFQNDYLSDESEDTDFSQKYYINGSDDMGLRKAYCTENKSAYENKSFESRGSDNSCKRRSSTDLLTKVKLMCTGEASSPLFFTDLRHMNSKIFRGRVKKRLKSAAKERPSLTASSPPFPACISPRKIQPKDETTCKDCLSPPLVARHNQIFNPSFFAGSDRLYTLPDRVPDLLQFADGKMDLIEPSITLHSRSSLSSGSQHSEDKVEALQEVDAISIPQNEAEN